jgi:hypothetical protein
MLKIRPMIPSRNPKGRESDTHSQGPVFKKVAGEPNRFEIVFSFRKFQGANEPDVASHTKPCGVGSLLRVRDINSPISLGGVLEAGRKIRRMPRKCLFDGATFCDSGVVLSGFGRFRQFSGLIFPLFVIFRTWAHGIPDPRSQPCVVAHP